MRRALDAMVIEGIKTTIPLHLKIMDNPDFQAGNISTRFMEDFLAENGSKRRPEIETPGASAALTGASA
jgi:acetyl/propionyl-CoA carboxylase alpha subunit